MRVIDAVAQLPASWVAEPLEEMLARVTRELWALTHEAAHLSDIAMGFVMPFLTHVLTTEMDLKVAPFCAVLSLSVGWEYCSVLLYCACCAGDGRVGCPSPAASQVSVREDALVFLSEHAELGASPRLQRLKVGLHPSLLSSLSRHLSPVLSLLSPFRFPSLSSFFPSLSPTPVCNKLIRPLPPPYPVAHAAD